jgi:hypothetical protein
MLDAPPIRTKWIDHVADRTRWDYDLWAVLMFQAWLEANEHGRRLDADARDRFSLRPSRLYLNSNAPMS